VNDDETAVADLRGTATPTLVVSITLTDANGLTESTTATTAGDGSWIADDVFAGTTLADGPIRIFAQVTDAYGNVASDTKNTTLDTVTIVTIDPVSTDDVFTPAEAQALEVTGTGEPGSTVTLTVSEQGPGGASVSESAQVSSAGLWSITLSVDTLSPGLLDFDVAALDPAGNSNSTSSTVTFDGNPITITIDDPLAGNNVVNENEENAVDISGDTLAGARVTVTIIDSANNRVGPVRVTADSLGNWVVEDVDLGGLVDGPLTIVAVAVDSVGNRADASAPSSRIL